jgi:hypothetical protein
MMQILFITSTNMASNPRCLKEVRLAAEQGHTVSVVAFEMDNWTKEKEQAIREGLKTVHFYYIPAGRSPFFPWLMAVLQEKASRWLFKLGWQSPRIVATAVNRRTVLIRKLLLREKLRAHLVVAHNPGAFYPAAWWAGRQKLAYALDVEDYHPGEGHDPLMRKLQERLIQYFLPDARYVSFASEPIMKTVALLGSTKNAGAHFVIDNAFSRKDFPAPSISSERKPLQLFWFSQNIDVSRGLEAVLPTLDEFADRLNLVLVGNLKQDFYQQYLVQRSYVLVKGPVMQEELHRLAGQYDAGLAIEPGKDVNNHLALSNKIWVYFQAGLYILATNTEGQRGFLNRFPGHGTIISLQQDDLRLSINDLLANLDNIRQTRQSRWEAAQHRDWENENRRLIKEWKSIQAS